MPSSRASEHTAGGAGEAASEEQAEQRERRTDASADDVPSVDAVRTELEARNAELEDRHRRALADLDNYRKRTSRDADERVAAARDAVTADWLEVLDSVERASRLGEGDPEATGLRAVLEQMEAILARHGVERIADVGEAFDPDRHEAVGVVDTAEVPDRTVVDVARSGFTRGDRTLRPALVVVARRAQP